jgi:hypothetical protein
MKSIGIEIKLVATVAALVASMGMAQAQSSGGGAGAAGSTASGARSTGMSNDMSNGMSKKSSSAAQDCRDHANTATGQKRNDTPQNADTDKTCADMMNKSDMKKSKKSMTGGTSGQPAPATSN